MNESQIRFIPWLLFLFFLCFLQVNGSEQKCKQCKFLVETFKAGMRNTEKQHFAGGNTDWEERKLGKFATSETRFLEVLEDVCKKEVLSNSVEYDLIKDMKFKCHTLVEEHEETLEKWFFKYQESKPDLIQYFCIDELRSCCPAGHFGKACEPCPGVSQKLSSCFGRGSCDGDGYREGTGKCSCNRGYVGTMCSNCDAHFYPVNQNDTYIECAECFDGCASGCTAEGPKGCRACRTGYVMDNDEGCKDVDECLEENKCPKSNERCINLVGSYRCECSEGYKRNKDQECEINIEADEISWISRPHVTLRIAAYGGLAFSSLIIYNYKPSYKLLILLVAATCAMIWIDLNMTEDTIPDEAKRHLQ